MSLFILDFPFVLDSHTLLCCNLFSCREDAYTDVFNRLQGEARRQGIEIRRGIFDSIDVLFTAFPSANAYFNCTGLGAFSLKGVEDKSVYPTRVYSPGL